MTTTQDSLQHRFPDWSWQFDRVLAPLTYFKIGGPAEADITLDNEASVVELLHFCRQQNIPVTVLGGASNVVVADAGVSGVVLHLALEKVFTSSESPQRVVIEAGCRTALAVSQTVALGWQGLEFFLGVPGTIGGAVYNNAHYLRHLISEHITRVKIIDKELVVRWLSAAECDFSYDHSRFHTSKEVILAAEFELTPGDAEASRKLIAEATRYRASTQPLGEPSSGCIFQNAPNTPELKQRFPQFVEQTHISAGYLIDQAGLKGFRVGDIEVSDIHAAFLVNKGNGTAQQVKEAITHIKKHVKQQLGVELREEVFYLG